MPSIDWGTVLTGVIATVIGTATVAGGGWLLVQSTAWGQSTWGALKQTQGARPVAVVALVALVTALVALFALAFKSPAPGSLPKGTPFLELTVRERGTKSFTAASGTAFNSGQVPRSSDPLPGLDWLALDTDFDPIPSGNEKPSDKLNSTLFSDEEYIRFFESDIFEGNDYKVDIQQVTRFLAPTKGLSKCLLKYIDFIPNSGLLFVDAKPVIKSMFILRARAKEDLTFSVPVPEYSYTQLEEVPFLKQIDKVMNDVNAVFSYPETRGRWENCQRTPEQTGPGKIDHRQPYTALVLADLIQAHGSPDEAIAVLAEWLTLRLSYEIP